MSDPLDKYRVQSADPLEKYRQKDPESLPPPEKGFWEGAQEMFHKAARYNPATMVPTMAYDTLTNPSGEVSRLRAGLHGMTLGSAPYLEAANAKLLGQGDQLASTKQRYQQSVEEHPIENIAGAAVVPVPGAGAKGLGGAALRVGSQGVMGGTAAALDSAPGDESEAFKRGAALGMTGAAAGEAIPPLVKALRNAAGKSFVRAVGPRAGIIDKLDVEGIRPENVSQLGLDFEKEGLVPVFGSKEKALELALARKKQLGSRYDVLDAAFDSARAPAPAGQTAAARPGNVGYDFARTSKVAEPTNLTTSADRVAGEARAFAEDIGKQTGGLRDARQNIADASRNADFRMRPTLAKQLHRESLGRAREDYMAQIGERLGKTAETGARDLNKSYALASTAADLAHPAASREVLHQVISPTHALLASHGGPAAMAAGALSHAAMARINAPLGYLLKNASETGPLAQKALGAAGRELDEEKRKALADWIREKMGQ